MLGALIWALVAAQDPPRPADLVYTFTAEQGWALSVENERELFTVSERELTQGITPNLRLSQDPSGTSTPLVNPPTVKPSPKPAPAKPAAGAPIVYRRIQGEPFKVEGTLTLRGDGTVSLAYRKLHYSDSGQRWWIEFEKDKVRTTDLGGSGKWSGTRAEWLQRLEALEKALGDTYVRALTPQPADEPRPAIGLVPSGQDSGRRLYVASCLEEQLSLLLLARLEGAALGKTLWPAEVAKYPPRAIAGTRAFVDRLVLQATGEIAPLKVRSTRTRSVKDLAWDAQGPAVPAFSWGDGAAWMAEQGKPLQESRRRLEDLANQTRLTGIDPVAWGAAVRAELSRLEDQQKTAPAVKPAGFEGLLLPRVLAAGRATYDFKEELDAKDGKVASSEADSLGLVRDLEVAFFVSGANRWHASRVRVETVYKGQVKLKP
jgi:hypothetical protein